MFNIRDRFANLKIAQVVAIWNIFIIIIIIVIVIILA